jgi:hypothetical protein
MLCGIALQLEMFGGLVAGSFRKLRLEVLIFAMYGKL